VTIVLYVIIDAAVVVFAVASVARALWYARQPIHLRWELYPVPHDPPEQVAHGGSCFEISEWWRARRPPRVMPELAFIVSEVLFLKGLWASNRPLWWRSFPFHFGLYLLGGTVGLIFTAALGAMVGVAPVASLAGRSLHGLYAVTGLVGLTLATGGALGLLHRRVTDPGLRPYTTPGDLFNLAFFLVVLILVGLGWLTRPAGSPGPLDIAVGLIRFDLTLQVAPIVTAALVAGSLLVAYIPLTHMSHFVGKYFTYHAVRWDDSPLRGNRRTAARLAEYLTYRPTWAASHVAADGRKTWADVVSPASTGKGRS
jgi:nitrate reductase gamma subunit